MSKSKRESRSVRRRKRGGAAVLVTVDQRPMLGAEQFS
jgi:hypothetical protein